MVVISVLDAALGGNAGRDASGEHNGRVAEQARSVFGRVGERERFTPEQQRERARVVRRDDQPERVLAVARRTLEHDVGVAGNLLPK